MILFTKEDIINQLKEIKKKGWIENKRKGNSGGIGNTLEDLLGIKENNLPIPNAAEWELKTQRIPSRSLITLFHFEPSPRAVGFVSNIFLPLYGWDHKQRGVKYSDKEKSFRQTISAKEYSDRGFKVCVDKEKKKILISFNCKKVSEKHAIWLKTVSNNASLGEISPQPYWGFDDLRNKAGTKLLNAFYVEAEVMKKNDNEFYFYKNAYILREFDFMSLISGLEEGFIFVDFDARTGHNHGTKFRLKSNYLPRLYKEIDKIL